MVFLFERYLFGTKKKGLPNSRVDTGSGRHVTNSSGGFHVHFHVDYSNIILLQEQSTESVCKIIPAVRICVLICGEWYPA